jgi:uncharacterized membrane protein YccC
MESRGSNTPTIRESRDDSYLKCLDTAPHLRSQLRMCLRVTVASLLSFVLGKSLNVPFGGLWSVLTAVVVTQMSVGGSLKATMEYLTGTLGGAIYAGVIAVLISPTNDSALLIALAIAVAPLAHAGPVDSALYRVLEVAIGGVTGLAVSLLVFPGCAHILVIEAAASILDLMAGVLPELLTGFMQKLDGTVIMRRQYGIGLAFTRLATIAGEATRERMTHLSSEPDTGSLLRALLRLRHDFVIIGRAAVVPFSEALQVRLEPPLRRALRPRRIITEAS